MPASRPEPGATEVVFGALLAAASGAVDVLAFTRIGHVFASVVTGNFVVVGVSIGSGDGTTLLHAVVSIAAYVVGVSIGSVGIRYASAAVRWPVQATMVCAAEAALLVVLTVLWLVDGGTPSGARLYVALAVAGTAMGLQTTAFRMTHVDGVTTTYFTGTLTGLLAGIVSRSKVNRPAAISLLALLAGAMASGLLVAHTASAAPFVPLGLVVVVVAWSVLRRRVLWRPVPG